MYPFVEAEQISFSNDLIVIRQYSKFKTSTAVATASPRHIGLTLLLKLIKNEIHL